MINANDIQTGCWVDYHEHEVRISKIYTDPDRFDVETKSTSGIAPSNPVLAVNLNYIPLSPAILGRAGFAKSNGGGVFIKIVNASASLELTQITQVDFQPRELISFPHPNARVFVNSLIRYLHDLQIRYYDHYNQPIDFS